MNNFTQNKLLLEGNMGKTLPLWIKATIKAYPELSMTEVDKGAEWLIHRNNKLFAAAYTDGDNVTLQVVSTKKYPELIKMVNKGIKRMDDVRDWFLKAMEVVKD